MDCFKTFRRLLCFLAMTILCCGLVLGGGCTAAPNKDLVQNLDSGNYGLARWAMAQRVEKNSDKTDRNYVIDRLRFMVAAMADGYQQEVTPTAEELFRILTVQGLNKDRTVTAVMINEDLKIWKGEPFEQALGFYYLAMHYAAIGSWDNARSAINNSLFHLKDFGEVEEGKRYDGEALVKKAQEDEKSLDAYTARKSTFTLGYIMKGVVCTQLARETGDDLHLREADEAFAEALAVEPDLKGFVDELRGPDYNTLLFVDYGRGPQKTGTGPDKAIAKFVPVLPSHKNKLKVTVEGIEKDEPVICDVNTMAQDHMWNNLEDVRIAKSIMGTALVAGGAAVMTGGSSSDLMVGGIMMLAGAAAKAGAHADTRYCEAIPQSCFIVPLNLGQETKLAFDLEPFNQSPVKMVLPGFPAPQNGQMLVRYIRLKPGEVPAWALGETPLYYTKYDFPADGKDCYPYILGGKCVRYPTEDVFREYQDHGFLTDMTYEELLRLYELEQVGQCTDHSKCVACLHVLEGGKCLTVPPKGTIGYVRIASQLRQPYKPKNPEVIRVAKEIEQFKMQMQTPSEQCASAK